MSEGNRLGEENERLRREVEQASGKLLPPGWEFGDEELRKMLAVAEAGGDPLFAHLAVEEVDKVWTVMRSLARQEANGGGE